MTKDKGIGGRPLPTFVGGVCVLAATLAGLSVAAGPMPQAGHGGHEMPQPPASTRADNPGHRGPKTGASLTPTVAFDRQGTLWAVWVDGQHVFVSSSSDHGRHFRPGGQVTRHAEPVDANGESRPKIALGADGAIYVTWTRLGAKPYTGDIRFARSIDGGRTFSAPVTVNDDGVATGHRFSSLQVSPSGEVYVAWIDKRDLEAAAALGHDYPGAALYFAVSTDRGRSFSRNHKIKDSICECCRLAIDFDDGAPVLFWRDVIGGTVRDHGLLRFTGPETPGPVHRATHDGWTIDACPHHGPSLSISSDGTYHFVWFTGAGPEGAGSFYAFSTDHGRTLSVPRRVAPAQTLASGHADVLSRGRDVVVAWLQIVRPGGMTLQVMRSRDSGRHWSTPAVLARTGGSADHPFLLADGSTVYVSWFTSAEGYRLLPVRDGASGEADTVSGR